MILRMIIITIIINLSLIIMINGMRITIITRIILMVMKIRVAMITLTIRLSSIAMIVVVILTIIITIILIVMITGIILKIKILIIVIIIIIITTIIITIIIIIIIWTVIIIIIQGKETEIIWFNLPFSKNVTTKRGRYFLNLLDKHFPQDHKFHKIFNRNNINFSYSCMPNIKSAINSHNRKILHSPVNNQSRTCNCINKTDCPLQEKCLSENTLYQADISSENFQTKIYYDISETKFKTRYSNHKKSFNHEKHKNDTQLLNELWKMKASKEEPVLVWKILGQYEAYNINTKRCLLCLNEKLQIAIYRGNNMLNKRTEIISKCRHRNKYALASYDSMD